MNQHLVCTTASHRLLLALVASCLIPVLAACRDASTLKHSPLVLLGIDGADWGVINPMIADGELPNFERMKSRGAWGELINPGPQVSPVAWTTFVTGLFSRNHGILDHVYPYNNEPAKRKVTSELRQAPALWNIADEFGLKSTVVGYFVSHPPEKINGTIVSELAYHKLEGAVHPSGALDAQAIGQRALKGNTPERQQLLRRFFGWDYNKSQAVDPDSPYRKAAETVRIRNLDQRILADEFVMRASLALAHEPSDLFVTYLRLVDYMSHSLWLYHDASGLEKLPDPELIDLFSESVKESYRYADEALGQLLDVFGNDTNIMVVSDHGFGPNLRNNSRGEAERENLTGNHRPNGIMLAMGPDIRPGEIRGMTIMEVAPTLVALLDIPVSDDMPGKVVTSMLTDEFFEKHTLKTVESYGDISIETLDSGTEVSIQQQSMQNLKGLGYIGEGVELNADATQTRFDFWRASDKLIAQQLHAEVMYHLLNEDAQLADQVVAMLQKQRPDLKRALVAWVKNKYKVLAEELPPRYFQTEPFEAFLERHPNRVAASRLKPENDVRVKTRSQPVVDQP